MNNKHLLITFFILAVLAQLFVPAKMILDREEILRYGKELKFRTAPVDPNDPFRGKYISLAFRDNEIEIKNNEKWDRNDPVFVILKTDRMGFSCINSVSKEEPGNGLDFVKARLSYIVEYSKPPKMVISFPFNRLYMDEFSAPEAEKIYRESQSDSALGTYALVAVKDGEAVLKDVLINGIPVKQLVNSRDVDRAE